MFAGSRPKAELNRHGYVGLASGRQEWDLPAFVLHICRKAKALAHEEIGIHGNIVLSSTLGYISWVEFSVPEFDAEFLAGPDPIIRADEFTLGRAPDPGS